MQYIHTAFDKYTMYQVVVTVLALLVFAAFPLSVAGVLPYSLTALFLSLAVVGFVSLATHHFFVWWKKAPGNVWSSVITALIVFLLFTPSSDIGSLLALALISFIAIAGKYVVQYRNLHLINPVVLAAVFGGITGLAYASWWVGAAVFFPFVLVGGLAIVLKIRRLAMVIAGMVASVLMVYTQAYLGGEVGWNILTTLLLSSPLLFFMTVMVTEPLTTPAGTKAQVLYGIFIGLLSNIPFAIGPVFNSPELTLLIANLLVYPLSLRGRVKMVCESVSTIANNTLEFVFTSSKRISFIPGQYLEWTLPHPAPDKRGTRRYFTIASSPTEKKIKLAVRMATENGSSYKQTLANFNKGDVLYATQLAGDFTLPRDVQSESYVFIAGGIGITPFRSQLKFLLDTKQSINAHLFYCNNSYEDIAYTELLKRAHNELGLGVTHSLLRPPEDWDGAVGYLIPEVVLGAVPDVRNRTVYISGPPGMVGAYKKLCINLGVPPRNIHTDYFPGLA